MLDDFGLSRREFAALIERPETFVSDLIKAKRQITVDTARRLEAALGPSADFWMRAEIKYRMVIEPADHELLARIRSKRPERVRDVGEVTAEMQE